MPFMPADPGVYIEELPSGLHTFTGVATSVAALVGTFRKTPLDVPLQILGMMNL